MTDNDSFYKKLRFGDKYNEPSVKIFSHLIRVLAKFKPNKRLNIEPVHLK